MLINQRVPLKFDKNWNCHRNQTAKVGHQSTVLQLTGQILKGFLSPETLSKAFNIFQVYRYFAVYRRFYVLKFEKYSRISYTTLFEISMKRSPFQAGKSTWYHPLLKGLFIMPIIWNPSLSFQLMVKYMSCIYIINLNSLLEYYYFVDPRNVIKTSVSSHLLFFTCFFVKMELKSILMMFSDDDNSWQYNRNYCHNYYW